MSEVTQSQFFFSSLSVEEEEQKDRAVALHSAWWLMHAGATKRERKGDRKSEGERQTEREMESAHDPYDMKAVLAH